MQQLNGGELKSVQLLKKPEVGKLEGERIEKVWKNHKEAKLAKGFASDNLAVAEHRFNVGSDASLRVGEKGEDESLVFYRTYLLAIQLLRKKLAYNNNIIIDENGKVKKVFIGIDSISKMNLKASNFPWVAEMKRLKRAKDTAAAKLSLPILSNPIPLDLQSANATSSERCERGVGVGDAERGVGVVGEAALAKGYDGIFNFEDLVKLSLPPIHSHAYASKGMDRTGWGKKKIKHNYHIFYKESKFYNKKVISTL